MSEHDPYQGYPPRQPSRGDQPPLGDQALRGYWPDRRGESSTMPILALLLTVVVIVVGLGIPRLVIG